MHKNNIIMISGKKLSGKSTFAEMFVDEGYVELAFANNMKAQCHMFINDILGVKVPKEYFYDQDYKEVKLPILRTGAIPETARSFMQWYGQLIKERYGLMYWTDVIIEAIESDTTKNYVISDLRFPFEYEGVKDALCAKYNIHAVRVMRSLDIPVDNDISETALKDEDDIFDFMVPNNGSLEDLKTKLCEILKRV